MSNSTDFAEARWRRLTDADAAEETLSPSDRAFLDDYEPTSAEGRAEAELFDALAQLGDDERHDPSRSNPDLSFLDAFVASSAEDRAEGPMLGALARLEDDEQPANSPLVSDSSAPEEIEAAPASEGPGSSRVGWIAVGALAAAAAAVLWLSSSGGERPDPTPTIAKVEGSTPSTKAEAGSPSAPVAPGESADEGSSPEPLPSLVVESGRLLDSAGASLVSGVVPSGEIRVDSEESCLGLGGATACFGSGARLVVGPSPDQLEVLEGRGAVQASSFTTHTMAVQIAGERYEISQAVTIETTVLSRSNARVEVTQGRVDLVDAQGQRTTLEAGAVRGKARAARPASVPDTKTLLAKANASRSAGDRQAAISYYEKLLRYHPRSAVSKAAMVSLGDLYLGVNKPAAALKWFERYLGKGGALSQEAHIGRIKALGALGRTKQKQRAIEEFRRKHPSSRYTEQGTGDTH